MSMHSLQIVCPKFRICISNFNIQFTLIHALSFAILTRPLLLHTHAYTRTDTRALACAHAHNHTQYVYDFNFPMVELFYISYIFFVI